MDNKGPGNSYGGIAALCNARLFLFYSCKQNLILQWEYLILIQWCLIIFFQPKMLLVCDLSEHNQTVVFCGILIGDRCVIAGNSLGELKPYS